MTIGEVSRRTGVRASALRYYESMKLLAAPHRVSGRRQYGTDVLDSVRVIQLAQAAGFSINEIRVLLRGFSAATPPSARWKALAEQKLVEVSSLADRINRMHRLLEKCLACECPQLADCARILSKDSALSQFNA
jgi:MerR family redox-sensitive transcriptional activator SoxR